MAICNCCNQCDDYCYFTDDPPQCGGECQCKGNGGEPDRVGVECLYRVPSGGQPCPDGDLPLGFGSTVFVGCYNSDDPDWCLCSAVAADEEDCFENYEYEPWLNPREDCGEGSDPNVPAPTNANDGCGGLIGPNVGNCAPLENPLP